MIRRSALAWRGTFAASLAIAAGAWLVSGGTEPRKPGGPPERLTVAISERFPGSGLILVAAANGYFTGAGLDVTLQHHSSGRSALVAALEGKAELATVAETPVMFAVLRGQPVAVVATISLSEHDNGIIARRDRGIATPADLRGRRIATTLGTTAHYVADALLTGNKILPAKGQLADLAPERLAGALQRGDVDAVSTWEPYLSDAARALGESAVRFHPEGLYRATFNLAGRPDVVARRGEALRRLLQALARAEQFVVAQPAEARSLVAQATGSEASEIERIWPSFALRLSLDQSLITLLEAQARWAIRERLVERSDMPNFLDAILTEPLTRARPEAVSVIR